ncbi:unnamed protein product [Rotaria socialis]|uniref:Uncharacterized protein n=1 Tax=Rotaria socialis TaxID=392032 RepID=A0A821EPA6_9BILA|nr:unnamed protein product [Rotaria socialis]
MSFQGIRSSYDRLYMNYLYVNQKDVIFNIIDVKLLFILGDRYFVGIFDSTTRSLTLCPLKSIIQFRPQFPYLDVPLTATSGLTSNKETNLIDDEHINASDGEQSGSESEENKPDPVGSLVTMKFEKKESEYHKKKHLQSYNYYRQTRDSERWQDLVCIMNSHSLDAQRIRQQLLSSGNPVTATNENN